MSRTQAEAGPESHPGFLHTPRLTHPLQPLPLSPGQGTMKELFVARGHPHTGLSEQLSVILSDYIGWL